jgi:membrane protein DedA with SNARE-associated domain
MSFAGLETLLAQYGYLAFTLVLIAAGFGVPIPEDVPLLIIGYLSAPANGILDPWITLVVALICITSVDSLFYGIGYYLHRKGGGEMPRMVRRFLTPARQEKIARYFERYGARTVFFGRFLPGLRTPILLFAGLWGVRPSRFLLADGSAVIITVPTMIFAGYFFGDNMTQIRAVLGRVEYIIAGGIVLFVIGSLLVSRWRNRRLALAAVAKPSD